MLLSFTTLRGLATACLLSYCAVIHAQSTDASLAAVRILSLQESKQLEMSSEGGSWRHFGIQAPACDPASLSKQTAKLTKIQKKKTANARVNCVLANKECKVAQKAAKNYGVQSICSPVYSKIQVLTTQSQILTE